MTKAVLTGGPCSGKSTTLEDLKLFGFNTLEEIAREVIKNFPDMSHAERQRVLFERQIEAEEKYHGQDVIFLDRGLPDVFAYSRYLTGRLVSPLDVFDYKKRYDLVFLFERLPFVNDGLRIETPKQAQEIHDAISEEYYRLGYDLIHVPVMPRKERVDYILERVKDYGDKNGKRS